MSRLTSLSFFTSKISITIIVTTLIWAVSDFSNRILTSPTLNKKENRAIEPVPLQLPRLNDDILEDINSSYSKYNKVEKDIETKTSVMSVVEQAKQQGELKSLYVGENKLQLIAVIKNNKKLIKEQYALLLKHNISTGVKKIEKHNQDSNVYGYHLIIEKNTQVTLKKENEQGKQEIVLKMYGKS